MNSPGAMQLGSDPSRTWTEGELLDELRALAAECLDRPGVEVDPDRSLEAQGLDSMAAAELSAELEDLLGRRVPEEWIHGSGGLRAMVAWILDGQKGASDPVDPGEAMHGDARLPDWIRPKPDGVDPGRVGAPPRRLLLTGATGFLGSHLLHRWVVGSERRVLALVRARDPEHARERIAEAQERSGLPRLGESDWDRIEVRVGDLTQAQLGLTDREWRELHLSFDAVLHGAARVDWTRPYAALARDNVHPIRELLALCCRDGGRPLHFISSIAAVTNSGRDGGTSSTRDEGARALETIEDLPLGYGQSKAVAESLVLEAGARGLPVSILRPALIAGDSVRGIGPVDDLLARLVGGCVALGLAPDVDWRLDPIPVDAAAEAIAELCFGTAEGTRVHHLVHPNPRDWREALLWLRLEGYPLRLLPYGEWAQAVRERATDPRHPLHALRPFFLGAGEGLSPAERLTAGRSARVLGDATDRRLEGGGHTWPALDSGLLRCWTEAWRRQGVLPPRASRRGGGGLRESKASSGFSRPSLADFSSMLKQEVVRIEDLGRTRGSSLVSELVGGRGRRGAGLRRWRVHFASGAEARTLISKGKASDRAALDVAEALCGMVDGELGERAPAALHAMPLRGSHLREGAVLSRVAEIDQALVPTLFGEEVFDGGVNLWMEDLASTATLLDTIEVPRSWGPRAIELALSGISQVHAAEWRDSSGPRGERSGTASDGATPEMPTAEGGVLEGPVLGIRGLEIHRDFFARLAEVAGRGLDPWTEGRFGARMVRILRDPRGVLGSLEQGEETRLHGDFSPRNAALRRGPRGLGLVAFDWELSTWGAPEKDRVEFLAHALTPEVDAAEARHFRTHAEGVLSTLRASTRATTDSGSGLRWTAALYEFGLTRLALLALVQRVRPQGWFERVVRTWDRLCSFGE